MSPFPKVVPDPQLEARREAYERAFGRALDKRMAELRRRAKAIYRAEEVKYQAGLPAGDKNITPIDRRREIDAAFKIVWELHEREVTRAARDDVRGLWPGVDGTPKAGK